jgi:hypothetical protein
MSPDSTDCPPRVTSHRLPAAGSAHSGGLIAALVLLVGLAAPRAAAAQEEGDAPAPPAEGCGLVWRGGEALWQLAEDGTPRELLRADAPIRLWAPSAAGHVAWIAGDQLFVRAAGSSKDRRLGPKKLVKGRFTRPIALEFNVSHLVVTMDDPKERSAGPFAERFRDDLLVPLPRELQSGPPLATIPTGVLCAGVGECEPARPRSPGGRWFLERSEQSAHGEAFPRLFRKAMRREDVSAEAIDLLSFNRSKGLCLDEDETRCAAWELESWGWLPGEHVWARLKDARATSSYLAVVLPADGTEAVTDGVALAGARGNPEGTRWILGALVCCDDGRCVKLPDDAVQAGWLPRVEGGAAAAGR